MARKIHTRAKRRLGISTHLHVGSLNKKPRKKRPKTFKAEESANEYAKKHGITKYILKNLRFPGKKKKIRIIETKNI